MVVDVAALLPTVRNLVLPDSASIISILNPILFPFHSSSANTDQRITIVLGLVAMIVRPPGAVEGAILIKSIYKLNSTESLN